MRDEEPTHADLPKAEHKQWDLGITFKSPNIWLWGNTATNNSLTTFPVVIPSSPHLGSVVGDITCTEFTAASRSIPCIRPCHQGVQARLQGDILNGLQGVKTKVNGTLALVQSLSTVDPHEMGGFRIALMRGTDSGGGKGGRPLRPSTGLEVLD